MAEKKRSLEDILKLPGRLKDLLDGIEGEIDYLRQHKFFEEFERLSRNTELMLEKMTELNENIKQFNISVQQISENTRAIGELEERMSVRGLIVSTVKDFFFLLRNIIEIAIVRNLRYLDELRKGKPLHEIFPKIKRKNTSDENLTKK
ncbi:MAG: hypothetical protein AB1546_07010 [bacterium]